MLVETDEPSVYLTILRPHLDVCLVDRGYRFGSSSVRLFAPNTSKWPTQPDGLQHRAPAANKNTILIMGLVALPDSRDVGISMLNNLLMYHLDLNLCRQPRTPKLSYGRYVVD